MNALPRKFYLRPATEVAPDLLGKLFVRHLGHTILIGKIVETEAYCQNDRASHSFIGRTKRNDVMFWEGGHLYIYFTYGMHFCANVVTGLQDVGEAVLLRAVEPLEGIEQMYRNRNRLQNEDKIFDLTNGPAKLCQAFGLNRHHNGFDLLTSEIQIWDAPKISEREIGTSARIGIRSNTKKPWRFFLKGNPYVSH